MTRKEREQPKATKSRIPTFKTIEEEATFWDTHSSEEFADELIPVENVRFVKARSKKAHTARSDEGMIYYSMTTSYRTLIPLFDELRGERIIVRPYRESDARDVFEAVTESRDHLRPWLPFADAHQTIEESRDWIIHQTARWLLREELSMSIWEAATNRFLGGTGLHVHSWDTGYFEIGYWIRASAQGHGYILEAVRLLTSYVFDTLKATRLEIRCDELNVRSAAIPQRLGFVREGCLRNHILMPGGRLRNTLVFSLIPGEWHDPGS